MKKAVLGLVLIVLGLALGLWLGVWVCLVGGVVSVIEGAKATPVDSLSIGWGIARVLLASMVGGFSAMALIFPGVAMVANSNGRPSLIKRR